MTEDEILEELAPQNISKVKRFMIKKDGQVKKTNTYLLTFNTTTLPQSINVGYLRIKVETFVPNPLRCFKCQRYGHGQSTCKGLPICHKCGNKDHGDDPCTGPLKCVNCAGGHASSSKQCQIWIKERAIQKLKVEKKLPYVEAKRQVEASQHKVPAGRSYADVTTNKIDASTQTDEIHSNQSSEQNSNPGKPEVNNRNDQTRPLLSSQMSSCTQNEPSPGRSVPPSVPPSKKPGIPPKPGGNKNNGRLFLVRNPNSRPQKGDDALHRHLPSSDDEMDFELASTSDFPPKNGKGHWKSKPHR